MAGGQRLMVSAEIGVLYRSHECHSPSTVWEVELAAQGMRCG